MIYSSVLEVGEELGVEDCVAVLDVVDRVEGIDSRDRDDGENDWDPDGGLLTGDDACVGGRSWGNNSKIFHSCCRCGLLCSVSYIAIEKTED